MKRFSIYFLFGFSVLTAASAYDYFFNINDWTEFYERWTAERADRLNDEALVAHSFFDARHDQGQLADFLEGRRRTNGIDFWVLYDGEKVIDTSLQVEELKALRMKLDTRSSEIVGQGDHFYTADPLGGGLQLVVGVKYNLEAFLKANFQKQRAYIIRYVIGIFTITVLIFAFFFRDFIQSVRLLSSGGKRSFWGLKSVSLEAEVLARGLASYDDSTTELKRENLMLGEQVLPSLRTELASGRAPPYEFTCTLVRTDINNFSKIYNDYPVEEFLATINDFFTDVVHTVGRYNGIVHEFIGDEVIFYFKDEAVGDSVKMALSAIRDINEIAADYSKETLQARGYPFTVKSSFAQGRLRFGRFVNGFGIAGPVLIETVRILSHVQEKEGNVVVFDERHRASVEAIATCEPYADVRFKGFSNDRHLLVYRGHRPVGGFLEPSTDFDNLYCYRSDDDLSAILAWLRRQTEGASLQVRLRVISLLRSALVTKTNGNPQQILLLWIEDLVAGCEKSKGRLIESVKVLSAALRLMENLVPPSEFSNRFESVLQHALKVDNRRVVANALEALTLFRRKFEPAMGQRLAVHSDNRVAANALVHEGIRSISPFVVRRLHKMLNSRNVSNIASGLYALGEIAFHHRRHDQVYYNTQIDFLRLVQSLPQYVVNQDQRIRRQAFIAARKVGDQKTLSAIKAALAQDAVLMVEAREHLDLGAKDTGASKVA